ncbi:hypothetical protein Tco_0034360 [Tanacetum coccineum]
MGKTIGELHAMLIECEKGLPNKDDILQVLVIQGGKIQKPNKKPQAFKGKGKGKGKSKLAYAPMPKNPPPAKKERLTKNVTCHHCKEVGYWRRNYLVYLVELMIVTPQNQFIRRKALDDDDGDMLIFISSLDSSCNVNVFCEEGKVLVKGYDLEARTRYYEVLGQISRLEEGVSTWYQSFGLREVGFHYRMPKLRPLVDVLPKALDDDDGDMLMFISSLDLRYIAKKQQQPNTLNAEHLQKNVAAAISQCRWWQQLLAPLLLSTIGFLELLVATGRGSRKLVSEYLMKHPVFNARPLDQGKHFVIEANAFIRHTLHSYKQSSRSFFRFASNVDSASGPLQAFSVVGVAACIGAFSGYPAFLNLNSPATFMAMRVWSSEAAGVKTSGDGANTGRADDAELLASCECK